MTPCARCWRDRPIKARGLCFSCYNTISAGGDLDRYPSARRQGPHGASCDACPDGGVVAPYRAVDGLPVSWYCVARAHPAGLPRYFQERPARLEAVG